jgi:chromosome segregation ATPase
MSITSDIQRHETTIDRLKTDLKAAVEDFYREENELYLSIFRLDRATIDEEIRRLRRRVTASADWIDNYRDTILEMLEEIADTQDRIDDLRAKMRHEDVECAHCGDQINEESNGTSSPQGSMHTSCVFEHEHENPSLW